MSFIEEFYYGNIDPQLRNVKENASFKQDMDSLCKFENSLRERLTGEDRELFIEYVNLWGVICGDLELCSYKEGFRHGAKFACDVFS